MEVKNTSLIFTATYNEKENVKKLIDEINIYSPDSFILIVEDSSPDGTGEILKELEKKSKNLKIIIREKKEGLDSAHKLAYEYAIKNNYKKIITMDADLSHEPKEIPIILKLLEENSFVIGSRYISGGSCEMSLHRWIMSYFGNKFIKLILNINCNEFTTSYRGFNINDLKKFHLNQVKSEGYSFFMETIFLINKLGYKIVQIPIQFRNRKHGKSKIPKDEILRTLKNLFLLKFFK
jgi:dolichol-phosphate mannosyltransferase